MSFRWFATLLVLGATLQACQQTGTAPFPTELDQFDAAGDLTNFDVTSGAYALPAPNLSAEDLTRHIKGDRAFEAKFVSAPAPVNPGLGPVFNNNSCLACHKGDGGGRAPEDGASSPTMLFRLSLPGVGPDGGPVPVPGFGGQLQDNAVFGVQAEAHVRTTYTAVAGAYVDGTPYTLRKPTHTLTEPYMPLPDGVMLSPRLSPPVYGLGLLEVVPEAALLKLADENDADHDGISGRPNMAWDVVAQAPRLGRFGWKANTPNLRQQIAGAYNQDMGVTTPAFPQEASWGQPQAPARSTADAATELTDDALTANVYYVRTLGVPARRSVGDAAVRQGAALFRQAQCASCHVPTLATGPSPEIPALAYQVIHPYTDLLLHDMGEDLADHRPDFLASGSEWRTPPLWGIGLRSRVQGHANMLHDGRANGFAEAILWHGGEAEGARQAFVKMSADERADLLAFLGSL